ncbi:MAG: XrtA/PEP-CTERM system TPR-repeat protein PrsT [Pseudomonadota bacterium]
MTDDGPSERVNPSAIRIRDNVKTIFMLKKSTLVSRLRRCVRLAALTVASLVGISACDFSVDNEERLARGQAAFEAGDERAAVLDAKAVLSSDTNNVEARLLLANASLHLGELEQAVFEFKRAAELGAEPSRTAVPLGEALLSLGRSAELLEQVDIVDSLSPTEKIQVLLMRAAALQLTDQQTAARDAYAAVLAIDAEQPQASVGLISTYQADGDSAKARQMLDALIEEHPDWVEAQLASAELMRAELRSEDAIAAFETILEDPALTIDVQSRALAGLVSTVLDAGNVGAADEALIELERLLPNSFVTLYLRASVELAAGNADDALAVVQPLMEAYPKDTKLALLAARAHLVGGQLGQAERQLERVRVAAPENAMTRRLLAEVRLRQGRVRDAEALLEPLLERGDADPALLQLALRTSVASGRPEAGVARYRNALAADPDNAELRFGLALSQISQGELSAAEATLADFDAASGERWEKDVLVALAKLRRGDSVTAVEEVDAVATQWPDNVSALRAAGVVAEAANQPDKAVAYFQRAKELQPDQGTFYLDIARVHTSAGDSDRARAEIERAIDADPDSVPVMLAMARLAAESEAGTDEAVIWLKRAAEASAAAFVPRLALAEHYRATGDLQAALTYANEAAALAPGDPGAAYSLGLTQLGLGDFEAAIRVMTDAVANWPDSGEMRHGLARAQLASGQANQALRTLTVVEGAGFGTRLLTGFAQLAAGDPAAAKATARRLVADFPDEAGPVDLDGQASLAMGEYAAAASALTRAYEMSPTDAALERATFARMRAGQDDADALLLAALEDSPNEVSLRRNYAHMLAAMGRPSDAATHYRQVLATDPDDVAALNNLAWILSVEGTMGEAETLARRAVDLSPDNPQANDTLGWILVQQGDIQGATARLRHALQQGAQDPEIRYHLAVALSTAGDDRAATSQLRKALETDAMFASRGAATELLQKIGAR